VDRVDKRTPIRGHAAVVGGSTYLATVIAAPGVVSHTSAFARVRCGRLDGRPDAALSAFVEQARAAGIDITLSDHMLTDIWKKFVLLSGTSNITAGTRQSLGPIRDDPELRALFFPLMAGAIAVGKAGRGEFPDDFPPELGRAVGGVPPGLEASMA